MCQDTRSGGVGDVLTIAEVCHDALIDLGLPRFRGQVNAWDYVMTSDD